MKVFINRVIPEAGLQLFEEADIEVIQWEEKRELTQEELITNCKKVDALLTAGRSTINAEFLNECKHLKVVSLFATGYDNVDIEEATKLKIPIGHTPDVLSKATADITFLLMQNVARKAFFHHKRIIKDDWNFFDPLANIGQDLQGKTLGIFGLGKIGFEMARASKAVFDMNIIYHNRSSNAEAEEKLGAKKVSFEELLAQSDVLSVHANLSDETKNLFNKDRFAKMKPNSIFINTARGPIHNEKDLTEALQNKTIWGAGLDVTNPEPMNKNNILLNLPNVAILPHIGSSTKETRNNMALLSAKNVIAAIKGERLPKVVNPEVYQ